MQMHRVTSGVVAVQRHFLSGSVGLTSCGVRRTRSVVPRSTAAVSVGRPSFGGQRTVSSLSRSGVLFVGEVLQPTRGLPRSEWAACPSAGSARSCRAQAPPSTVRCSSAAALRARRGRSQPRLVVQALASCKAGCQVSIMAGTLTVMNAVRAKRGSSSDGGARARSSGTALQGEAPNPSVKRTRLRQAAYLKR